MDFIRNNHPDAIEQFYIQLEATLGKIDLSIDNAASSRQLELKIHDVTINVDVDCDIRQLCE